MNQESTPSHFPWSISNIAHILLLKFFLKVKVMARATHVRVTRMDKATLPKMSLEKELFLKELERKYPLAKHKIQSRDEGLTIDVIFGRVFYFTMTEEEHFSVTAGGQFKHFTTQKDLFLYFDDFFNC